MISNEQLEARNRAISENGKATRARRSELQVITRTVKLKPNNTQKEALDRLLLEAKWYRNAALGSGLEQYDTKLKTVNVKTPKGLESRALTHLGSHHKQSILAELAWNKKSLNALKNKGRKIGSLRFVSEVNSLSLKQVGVTYRVEGNRARLQGVKGWVPILGSRQLRDLELANAKVVRKPSGYYLQITGYRVPVVKEKTSGPIGLDMGVSAHLTLSDGSARNSVVKESERLKRAQRKLARQQKGSNNYAKTVTLIRREQEKLTNKKKEWANQLINELSQHELIYYQDENLKSWVKRWNLQHSGLGRLKSKLALLENAVMVPQWVPTTQYCPACDTMNKLPLSVRVYSCSCGYSAPRDEHAARNMILLGSKILSGQELSVAPVDQNTSVRKLVFLVSDVGMKQETDDQKSHAQKRNNAPLKRDDL